MNSTTFDRIIARAHYEMQKAGIITTTKVEHHAFNSITKLHIDGEPSNQNSGWIIISAKSEQLILIFGDVRTGQNFACYISSHKKDIARTHIALMKAVLNAKFQRENMFNGYIFSSINYNWNLYKIGDE